MKKLLLLFTLLASFMANATHIVGGELVYQHLGGSSYYLTVKLYKDCNPGTQNFPNDLEIEAFTGFGTDTIGTLPADDFFVLPRLDRDTLAPNIDTCAFNPGVCVEEAIYGAVVSLPPVDGGYHLFYQTYARNGSLLNIVDPLQAGESFYAYVPDNSLYLTNSSPVFSNSPPVFVCQGYDLNLDFSATDVDGDSLVYSFYTPYTGRSWDHPDHYDPTLYYPTIDLAGTPPDNIDFVEVVYNPGFSADNPLNAIGGVALTITDGIINGIPEAVGQYVVGVMVEEYRDGVKIGEIVRDFQFNVLNCPPPKDAGIGEIDGCAGFVVDFVNESGAGASGFWWDFGTGVAADTSILESPTFDFTPFAPETFNITLIAQKGTTCADTTSLELILSGVTAAFAIPDTACSFEPIAPINTSSSEINGTITSWEWDFGDGTTSDLEDPIHEYSTPGDYTISLIVTTNVGCSDTLESMLHVRAHPGAGILPMMGCIGLEDVAFTSTSSAEVTTFHWDFGTGFAADTSDLENPTFTYADYGVYTVTLITEPGTFCADTATLELMISNATADFAAPDTTCADVLIDFIDLSSTNNGEIFSWEWDFGDGSSSTDSDPSYGYTVPGTYTITLIVISDIGCTDTITKEITIYDAPQAVIGPTDFCSGLTIDFTNGSDDGASDFWWDFGTGSVADTSILVNPTFTYGSYGTYTVTLIAQKGSECETSTMVDISISDLTGAISAPDTACVFEEIAFTDLSVTVDGTVLTEWEWDFGDLITSDLQNPTHAYSASGDFEISFVVHSDVGCTDTVLHDIHIQEQPTSFAGLDTSLCLSDPTLELDGSIVGADGGIWSGAGGVFSPSETDLDPTYFPTLDELDAGFTNLVLTTVGNGYCPEFSDTITVFYLGDPNVNAGGDIGVCEDSTYIELDATVGLGSEIIWTTDGDGTFADDESLSTIYTFGAGDILAGTVEIYINTINFSGCPEDADTVTVTFNAPPTLVAMSDTTICSGIPLLLESNSSTGNGIWDTNGDGLFDPETGETTTYNHGTIDLASGFLQIFFESTDNGGCNAVYDTLSVFVIPSPEADFSFTEDCFGIPTEFTNETESDDPIATNFWELEPGITSGIENPTHSFSEAGTYNVNLIVTSENGCIDTMTKEVRSHFIPLAGFDVPAPCLNGGTVFLDTSAVGNAEVVSWNWDFGDDSPADTTQNPTHQYPSEGAYDITLSVTSEFGCTDEITVTMLINLGPIADFDANPGSANLFVDIDFTDASVENGAPITGWEWNYGDGNSDSTQNTVHQFDFEGEYDVELIVTDDNGCIDTAYKVIPIYHGPLVPSAFSPNGDLNNDFLMLLGGNFTAVDFTIYNNWGEIVFQTNDVDSDGWDGTYKGEPQPLGVYVYVATVVTFDGEEHFISGDVSLIR